MNARREVTVVSPRRDHQFEPLWYDASTPDHFWQRFRFEVLFRALGAAGLDAQAPLAVLDAGGGKGVFRHRLEQASAWRVDCADLDYAALSTSYGERGENLYYDLLDRDSRYLRSYDVVLMLDVIEHLSDPREFVEANLDHLKPGGCFAVNVPAHQWLYGGYDRVAGHVKRYDLRQLRADLPERVSISKIGYWGMSLVPILFLRKLRLSADPRRPRRREPRFRQPECLAGTTGAGNLAPGPRADPEPALRDVGVRRGPSARVTRKLIPLAAILVVWIVAFPQLDQYGVNWDEALGELFYGERYWSFFTSLDPAYLDFESDPYPPDHTPDLGPQGMQLPAWASYPVSNTLAAATSALLHGRLGWLDPFESFHAVNLLLVALFLWVFFRFVESEFGLVAALAALGLFFGAPRVVSHMMANTKDFPQLVLFAIVLIAFLRAHERASTAGLLGAGVLLGLGIGMKPNALFIPPIVAAMALGGRLPEAWQGRRGRMIATMIGAGLLAIPVFVAVWPWIWAAPVERLGEYLDWIFVLHWGLIRDDSMMGLFPTLWMTTPPLFLALIAVGLYPCIRRAPPSRSCGDPPAVVGRDRARTLSPAAGDQLRRRPALPRGVSGAGGDRRARSAMDRRASRGPATVAFRGAGADRVDRGAAASRNRPGRSHASAADRLLEPLRRWRARRLRPRVPTARRLLGFELPARFALAQRERRARCLPGGAGRRARRPSRGTARSARGHPAPGIDVRPT